MTTHSSILTWRIPWTEEPGGLQSIESHRVEHDGSDLSGMYLHRYRYRYVYITWTHIQAYYATLKKKEGNPAFCGNSVKTGGYYGR